MRVRWRQAVPTGTAKVGLSVDADNALLDQITTRVPLDILQLHGSESPERVTEIRARYGLPVMKAVGVANARDLAALEIYARVADMLLVDAKPPESAVLPGGNGLAFDWRLIAGRRWPLPWMLAGGLTPGQRGRSGWTDRSARSRCLVGRRIRAGRKGCRADPGLSKGCPVTVRFREAQPVDVRAVLALLTDDRLGAARETDELDHYLAAFEAMREEGNNFLIVGENAGRVVATYQLTFISGLSLRATRRAQIESVRVASDIRGLRIGEAMLADAETRARGAGCKLLQLTMNRSRTESARFYERLGFTPSHIGYKRDLS